MLNENIKVFDFATALDFFSKQLSVIIRNVLNGEENYGGV